MSNDAKSPENGVVRRRGLMYVLSSPSGAGKTTISRRLLELDDDIEMSISVTTRPPRPGEEDGRDYIFVSDEEFSRLVGEGALLEYAHIFGYDYGTPREPVESALAAGRDILFDIDWQGTQQLKDKMPDDLVTVFILPPSTEELRRRLVARAQDSEDVVDARMAKAADEMSHFQEYDYIIFNRDLDESIEEARTILFAERRRQRRLVGVVDFVAGLRKS